MYKTILIPIDGSVGSSMAVDHCIELLESIKPERIILFHVALYPSQLEHYSGKLGATAYKIKNQLKEYGEEILAAAKSKFTEKKCDVTVKTKIVLGDPKYEIVRESEDSGCDLLIIGNRGLSGIKSFFIGSVSNYVAHNVKCTVTIVKKESA